MFWTEAIYFHTQREPLISCNMISYDGKRIACHWTVCKFQNFKCAIRVTINCTRVALDNICIFVAYGIALGEWSYPGEWDLKAHQKKVFSGIIIFSFLEEVFNKLFILWFITTIVWLFVSAWETCKQRKKPYLLNTVWQCQLRFLHSRTSELSFQPDDGIGVN